MSNLDEVIGKLIRIAANTRDRGDRGEVYLYRDPGPHAGPEPFEADYIRLDPDGDVGIYIP